MQLCSFHVRILKQVAINMAAISLCMDDTESIESTSKKRALSSTLIGGNPSSRRTKRCFWLGARRGLEKGEMLVTWLGLVVNLSITHREVSDSHHKFLQGHYDHQDAGQLSLGPRCH